MPLAGRGTAAGRPEEPAVPGLRPRLRHHAPGSIAAAAAGRPAAAFAPSRAADRARHRCQGAGQARPLAPKAGRRAPPSGHRHAKPAAARAAAPLAVPGLGLRRRPFIHAAHSLGGVKAPYALHRARVRRAYSLCNRGIRWNPSAGVLSNVRPRPCRGNARSRFVHLDDRQREVLLADPAAGMHAQGLSIPMSRYIMARPLSSHAPAPAWPGGPRRRLLGPEGVQSGNLTKPIFS